MPRADTHFPRKLSSIIKPTPAAKVGCMLYTASLVELFLCFAPAPSQKELGAVLVTCTENCDTGARDLQPIKTQAGTQETLEQ